LWATCPKLLYFFIDTNHLDVNSTCSARDAMDVDSNAEDEGDLIFPKLKQSSNAIDSGR
jgi:hypothetical protein